MIVTTQLKSGGLTVLAKMDKKYGLCAKTFANRTQAYNAMNAIHAEGTDYVCHVTYSRPFYVVVRTWEEAFGECCESFRLDLNVIANTNGKPLSHVFAWWREYERACSGEGGQSCLVSEFERWYEPKLKATPANIGNSVEEMEANAEKWAREHPGDVMRAEREYAESRGA